MAQKKKTPDKNSRGKYKLILLSTSSESFTGDTWTEIRGVCHYLSPDR